MESENSPIKAYKVSNNNKVIDIYSFLIKINLKAKIYLMNNKRTSLSVLILIVDSL